MRHGRSSLGFKYCYVNHDYYVDYHFNLFLFLVMFLFSHCLCQRIINLMFDLDISLSCVDSVHYYYESFWCFCFLGSIFTSITSRHGRSWKLVGEDGLRKVVQDWSSYWLQSALSGRSQLISYLQTDLDCRSYYKNVDPTYWFHDALQCHLRSYSTPSWPLPFHIDLYPGGRAEYDCFGNVIPNKESP